jgi:hypothetical protein
LTAKYYTDAQTNFVVKDEKKQRKLSEQNIQVTKGHKKMEKGLGNDKGIHEKLHAGGANRPSLLLESVNGNQLRQRGNYDQLTFK